MAAKKPGANNPAPAPLADWPRPQFEPGGGDAFLFFVVFGSTPREFNVSGSKYRFGGLPEGIELMSYGPESEPEVVGSFREGYPWESLLETNPRLAATIEKQTECVILQGSIADPRNLNYFRDVIGLITWMLDSGAAAVHDLQTASWWGRAEWRKEVFELGEISPLSHVAILVSENDEEENDGMEWFHTRGMRQFGRPDISVHNVTPDDRDAVIDLCNRFIGYQAQGGVIPEGEEVEMDSLPAGMICTHRGDFDDLDFNNVHVEVLWPEEEGG